MNPIKLPYFTHYIQIKNLIDEGPEIGSIWIANSGPFLIDVPFTVTGTYRYTHNFEKTYIQYQYHNECQLKCSQPLYFMIECIKSNIIFQYY